MSAETPLQYAVGFEYQFEKPWTLSSSIGLLSKPNSAIILTSLEAFGVDEGIVLMIENAFESGLILQASGGYRLKHHHFKFHVQEMFLTGKDTPNELVEQAMGVDMANYPRSHRRNPTATNSLTLKSNLTNIGLGYEYRFHLSEAWQLGLGLDGYKTIFSKSSVQSEYRDLTNLSIEIDDYLESTYATYAYLPALSLTLLKTL